MMNTRRMLQAGLSMVELMISLTIGMALLVALIQVFISNRTSFSLQERMGQMQENGRYALSFLQRDIRNAGQPFDDFRMLGFLRPADAAPNNTVDGGGNVSDRISVQYRATVATTDCLGNNVAANAVVVTTYSINVDGTTGVSRLMCAAQGQAAQPIVDGIENMQIQYGVDRTPGGGTAQGDGVIDLYVPASQLTAAEWGNTTDGQRRILAVRISILASAVTPVSGDTVNDNTRTFALLDAPPVGPLQRAYPFPSGVVQNLRARIFTTTIEVRNRSL